MKFRLSAILAMTGAILLYSVPARTQQQSAPSAQEQGQKTAPDQQATPSEQENTPAAPIEPVLSGPYPVMSKAAEDRGRQAFEMFNHQQTSQMWAALSEGLRKQSGKEERFTEINKKLHERLGAETSVIEENIIPYPLAPDTIYSRLSNFANVPVPVVSSITINQRGQIDNFSIRPMPTVAEGRYAGYQDTVKLHLPFKDEWLVYQGGRNLFESAYSGEDEQRFSLDFVYLKNGRLFSGAGGIGSKNEDYYCFGQPVLAPADGTVIKEDSGYDDNPPGKPTGDSTDGNFIVISHGNGESSLLNHLKQNSLKVKRGDKVKQGDVVAECGNSGEGPVPHIHYQLQKTGGVGLPAQFVDYIADGKPVASGEPKRGEFVKNNPDASSTTSSKTSGSKTPSAKPTGNTTEAQTPSH